MQVILSFKLFVRSIFFKLTFVNCIYLVSVHWSWNFSSGLIANFQWSVSKLDIRIWFPRRPVEGCGKVPVFVIAPGAINKFIGFKTVLQVIQVWSCVGKFWIKGNQGAPSTIGLIRCVYLLLRLKVVCFIFVLLKNCLFL